MSPKKLRASVLSASHRTLRPPVAYGRLVSEISHLLEQSRRLAAKSVNAILTTTYWEIGRRIVEHEQLGEQRAEYGDALLQRLAADLTTGHGRGFSRVNLQQMRLLYLGWEICQTVSGKFEARVVCPATMKMNRKCQTVSDKLAPRPKGSTWTNRAVISGAFPLSWSHYVRLMSVSQPLARAFYESETIRGGWSVRQLDRQVGTQFYERAVKARNPKALLARALVPMATDSATVEEQVRDPYLLEFLDLKDEYSETELEDALVRHLEWFLLELGAGFTFVARQKRIRVGGTWYRMDLLLYHRGLRCLVVLDLKTGAFTHADAGQMNLYLNYAREHLSMPGESDPIGIILCSDKDDAVVKYATGGIRARVFASKYLTYLPDEETLRREILTTQRAIEARKRI